MLDTLEVRTRTEAGNADTDDDEDSSNIALSGFEVMLHPPSQFMKQAAVESSAWNKHCALSLLMGLAIHPSMQTVEVGQSIELHSMEFDADDDGESSTTPMSNDIGYLSLAQSGLEQEAMTSRMSEFITSQ